MATWFWQNINFHFGCLQNKKRNYTEDMWNFFKARPAILFDGYRQTAKAVWCPARNRVHQCRRDSVRSCHPQRTTGRTLGSDRPSSVYGTTRRIGFPAAPADNLRDEPVTDGQNKTNITGDRNDKYRLKSNHVKGWQIIPDGIPRNGRRRCRALRHTHQATCRPACWA